MNENIEMDKHDLITARAVRAMFAYDREVGVFRWRYRDECGPVWNARYPGTVAGWKDWKGYVILTINYRDYRAHRVAWLYETGEWPVGKIDHKNGIVDDNRFKNFRIADKSQNARNSKLRVDNKSGVKGVWWDKARGMWEAYVKVDGKKVHLGRFVDLAEAKSVRQHAAGKSYGEFARES